MNETSDSSQQSPNCFDDALRLCVSNMREVADWPVGHAWVRTERGDRMTSSGIWSFAQNIELPTFIDETAGKQLISGEGFIGGVWKSGDPVWITDLEHDTDFVRRSAITAGLVTAFGLPLRIGSEVVAVVELLHTVRTSPDLNLLKLGETLGKQLGRLFDQMNWQEERIHLAAIVDSSADAIISKGLDGTIRSWNAGAERVYGWSAEEAIGQTIAVILPPGMAHEESEILEAMKTGRRLEQFSARRQHRDGHIVDVSITVSPVRGRHRHIIGSSTIERDITRSRRREHELRVARDAAEAASRVRGEFMANVSHELRTPMNAILGMLELALQEQLDPVTADYLGTAKHSADSLLMLVNDILDFSRLEAGRFELDPVDFILREMVEETVRALSVQAHEKGLELACRLDESVPREIVADPARLRQILTNLVGNAVKFTEQGEVLVEVTCGGDAVDVQQNTTLQPGDDVMLQFCVSDTGIGINDEDQYRIFAPFTQADASSTRRYSGTGLGLTICHELCDLMNGRLWVESEAGIGSRFYFTAGAVVGCPAVISASSAESRLPDLEGISVLVVDDNETNRRILDEMLCGFGMTSTVADGVAAALQCLEGSDGFDVVIVDALMPESDGLMLVEVARSAGLLESATILMLSSADRQIFQDRCDELGISTYLEKPVAQVDLVAAILKALNRPLSQQAFADAIIATLQPLRILVVEDTPANQKVIQAILHKRGHQTRPAGNGREAVDRLRSEEFDAVLMDVQMPAMDGLQATAAIREFERKTDRHTPIIAMTAHALRGDREKCLKAGMDSYISKPIDAARMIELVERLGRRARSESERAARRPPVPIGGDSGTKRVDADVHTPCSGPDDVSSTSTGIDMQQAMKRIGNDRELLRDMIGYFCEDAPDLLNTVLRCAKRGDAEELERAAHSLKGLCANFGAETAERAARTVEQHGREGALEDIETDLRTLKEEISRVTAELALWESQDT